jgi:hypothetical protein
MKFLSPPQQQDEACQASYSKGTNINVLSSQNLSVALYRELRFDQLCPV